MPLPPAEPAQNAPNGDAAPRRVEALFHEALDLEPPAREAFLNHACAGDSRLRSYVDRLLLASDDADQNPAWNKPAIEIGHATVDAANPAVDRYRLLECIGVGGMGVVYRAIRSDDAYSKEVAIKIVQWAVGDAGVLERFRAERQILANLEHPNIARLLDGGATADGSPFLVMEFIHGVRIDKYVAERKPPLRALLELFRRICSAVGYAHGNLVVHRDLKPGNILVTEGPEGAPEPKLLDFGIARLLDDPVERTRSRAMTIEYASPEQISGASIGVASDIYSLGVLLYELVSGSHPYRATTSAMDLAQAICREDPQPLGAAVDADLANIILMALRKEPARRYESAGQFSEDLQRFLDGYPVKARPDTRGYRARKFVGRNKLPLAAVALVLITLAGGVFATVRQARIANRRFNDVRSLAHSVLFDYHDAIVALPGAIRLRQMLVKDGLVYLDRLSKEAGSDARLQLELAGGYMKVADVQGSANGSNLGDVRGGLKSYRKAIVLLEELHRRDPENQEIQEILGLADRFFGQLSQQAGDLRTAADRVRTAIALYEPLCSNGQYKMKQTLYSGRMYFGMDDRRNVLSGSYLALGRVSGDPAVPNLGDQPEAERWYRKNIAFLESLPSDKDRLGAIGFTHGYLASLKGYAADYSGELAERRAVVAIKLRVLQMPPVTPFDRRELAIAYSNFGVALLESGDFVKALENFQLAGRMLDMLAAADPDNEELKTTLANNTRRIAESLSKLKRYPEASAIFRRVIGTYQQLAAKNPGSAVLPARLGLSWIVLAEMHSNTGNGRGTWEAASLAEKALAPLGDGDPVVRQLRARSYLLSGKGQELSGNWTAARDWYKRSLDLWRALQSKGQLAGANLPLQRQAEQALAESEKHVRPDRK